MERNALVQLFVNKIARARVPWGVEDSAWLVVRVIGRTCPLVLRFTHRASSRTLEHPGGSTERLYSIAGGREDDSDCPPGGHVSFSGYPVDSEGAFFDSLVGSGRHPRRFRRVHIDRDAVRICRRPCPFCFLVRRLANGGKGARPIFGGAPHVHVVNSCVRGKKK